jgi:hypothetical protein
MHYNALTKKKEKKKEKQAIVTLPREKATIRVFIEVFKEKIGKLRTKGEK